MHLPWSRGSSVHSATHPWPFLAWTVFLIFPSLLAYSFQGLGLAWLWIWMCSYTCSLHFSFMQPFVHCSCICHGLKAHLCILSLIFDLLWRKLFFWFPFFIGLLLSRVVPCLIVGFLIFNPFFAHSIILLPFLPYHSAVLAMVSFGPCLLGLFWAYYLFFSQWLSMVIGFILMLLWAFLTYYIACGRFCPTSFFLGILGLFALLGYPWPIF